MTSTPDDGQLNMKRAKPPGGPGGLLVGPAAAPPMEDTATQSWAGRGVLKGNQSRPAVVLTSDPDVPTQGNRSYAICRGGSLWWRVMHTGYTERGFVSCSVGVGGQSQ